MSRKMGKQWLFTGAGLAVSLFLIYTLVAVGAAVVILVFLDFGTEVTTLRELDGQGELIRETTEESDSVPVIAVLSALAVGGWLLIPLRFAWTQLANDAAAVRDNRKATSEQMRKVIFERIDRYFGPMLYRHLAIMSWGQRCLDRSGERKKASYQRLLYCVAELSTLYGHMRTDGVVLQLRSTASELQAGQCNFAVIKCLDDRFFRDVRDEDDLVRAIQSERGGRDNSVIGYLEFVERLSGVDPRWLRLREIHNNFCSACETEADLKELVECANRAYGSLRDGVNGVFAEWYSK